MAEQYYTNANHFLQLQGEVEIASPFQYTRMQFSRVVDLQNSLRSHQGGGHAPGEGPQPDHFGWICLAGCYLPYIYRGNEKFCSIRMLAFGPFNFYLKSLHPDIYNIASARGYSITADECYIFNEINNRHELEHFGWHTTQDAVMRLVDATNFMKFFEECYQMLKYGAKKHRNKCGFIQLSNKAHAIPYVLVNNTKMVPLHCFEDIDKHISASSIILKDWALAYLKFCYVVLELPYSFESAATVAMVKWSDVVKFLPKDVTFKKYWPPQNQLCRFLLNPRGIDESNLEDNFGNSPQRIPSHLQHQQMDMRLSVTRILTMGPALNANHFFMPHPLFNEMMMLPAPMVMIPFQYPPILFPGFPTFGDPHSFHPSGLPHSMGGLLVTPLHMLHNGEI